MLESLKEKILYSTSAEIGLRAEQKAENKIKVEETGQGLKFSQKDRQTQVYSDNKGVQTTVPFYEEVREKWEEPIKLTETG